MIPARAQQAGIPKTCTDIGGLGVLVAQSLFAFAPFAAYESRHPPTHLVRRPQSTVMTFLCLSQHRRRRQSIPSLLLDPVIAVPFLWRPG
jgi:hypothetical protein